MSTRYRRRLALSCAASPEAMPEPATAAEVARSIADTFERHGIPYAIGGAIALAYYAPPRATIDVDVNVFVPIDERFADVVAALSEAGFALDGSVEAARSKAAEDGQFIGRLQGLRVDVFVPSVPYYGELKERRREVPLLGRPAWVLGPEDLAVLKMMFFRRKDLADVEAMLRDQRGSFDRAYVRRRLVEFVGQDDARLASLATIERDVDAGE